MSSPQEFAIFKSVRSLFSRRDAAVVAELASAADEAKTIKSRGNELLGEGKIAEAVDCYRRVVELTPLDALAWINLGYGLLELGHLQAASDSLVQARELDEQLADAHFLLGQVLGRQGLLDEAARSVKSALTLKPDFDFAWLELGRLHERLGDPAAALDDYSRVLALTPAFPDAVDGKARMLLVLERWQEALAITSKQLELERNYWFEILKARALHGLKKHTEALALFDNVLDQRPQEIQALECKAGVLVDLHQFVEAIAIYRQVVALKPDFAEAWSNCGAALGMLGDFHEAMICHEKAEALRPGDPIVLRNMGATLLGQRRYRELIAMADRGLERHPQSADLHYHKAWGHLLLGDLRQGFSEYEWRWEISSKGFGARKPAFPQPQWLGEPISGKTILIHWEQGLGDSIQMLRYIPLLAEMGARVSLYVQPAIAPLCAHLKDVCTLIGEDKVSSTYDYYSTLMSLPLACGTSLEAIPACVPYLHSDAGLRSAWLERLPANRGPRIGLVWSGNPNYLNDHRRSVPLQLLVDAFPAGVQLVSLQKEIRPSDRRVFEQSGIFDASEGLHTFADTAALAECMDLVISVDTSVAHLAGALGKPVWILLPYGSDWRWMSEREDSPWYPSARLFRQQEDRSWPTVAKRIAQELPRMFPAQES